MTEEPIEVTIIKPCKCKNTLKINTVGGKTYCERCGDEIIFEINKTEMVN